MAKHNKLKNSGLLFELLVRQITTDTLNNRDSEAVNILKKYFYKTELLKEYNIYNTVASAKNLSEVKAGVLLDACIKAYNKLDKGSLRKQKYDLIAEVKTHYNIDDFFRAKVSNYKVLASVYQLLEMNGADSLDEQVYANCKFTLLEHMSAKKEDAIDTNLQEFISYGKGTRSLIYEIATKKLNEKFASLNESQRGLLNAYINNISDSDKLKSYYNEQVDYIKLKLAEIAAVEKDDVRRLKLEELNKSVIKVPANKSVLDSDVSSMLQYHELLKEYDTILNEHTS